MMNALRSAAAFVPLATGVLALGPSLSCVTAPSERTDQAALSLADASLATDDPGTVALVAAGAALRLPSCTGTLVSPRVVLIAAHCVPDVPNPPPFAVFFGGETLGKGLEVPVIQIARHPAWSGDISGGHDVALLLLEQHVDPAWAVPLNVEPIEIGTDVRVVGFGRYDPVAEPDGKKRTGAQTIFALREAWQAFDATGDARICGGDSGGPAFIVRGGVEYLAGVTSAGELGAICFDKGVYARVDLFVEDFIKPFIAANDSTCAADAVCAPIGCDADPDCEAPTTEASGGAGGGTSSGGGGQGGAGGAPSDPTIASGGGCAVSPARGGAAAWIACVGMMACARRRRRRWLACAKTLSA